MISFAVKPVQDYKVYAGYSTDLTDYDTSCDLMVSIGGDGTFLESIPYVIQPEYTGYRY